MRGSEQYFRDKNLKSYNNHKFFGSFTKKFPTKGPLKIYTIPSGSITINLPIMVAIFHNKVENCKIYTFPSGLERERVLHQVSGMDDAHGGHVNCPIVLTTGPVRNETRDIGSAITPQITERDAAHRVSTPGEPYMNKTVCHACKIIYNSAHNGGIMCPSQRGFRGIKELNLRHGMQIMERFIIIITAHTLGRREPLPLDNMQIQPSEYVHIQHTLRYVNMCLCTSYVHVCVVCGSKFQLCEMNSAARGP
jgi:hypothetical protein